MRIKVITSTEKLESLKTEWNALLEETRTNAVNLTHEWIMSWWTAFGAGSGLFVMTVYDRDDSLIGIAPFMKTVAAYRGIRANSISLMANGHSPSSGIISRERHAGAVVGALIDYLRNMRDIDLIEFKKLDSGGAHFAFIEDHLKKKKAAFGMKPSTESPIVRIYGQWDDFLNSRSHSFRKSLRNKINRSNKERDLTVEKKEITSSSDPILQEMFQVSEKSWKKEIGADLTNMPHSKEFHLKLCDRLGPKGIVSLQLLKKGTRAVAFEFHLTYNGVVYPIRADYDKSFSSLSPGSILEFNILKTLFDESRVKEYNSCGHTYRYLMNWTDDTIKHIDVEVFPPKMKSYGLYLLEYGMIPVLRRYGLNKLKKYWRSPSGHRSKSRQSSERHKVDLW